MTGYAYRDPARVTPARRAALEARDRRRALLERPGLAGGREAAAPGSPSRRPRRRWASAAAPPANTNANGRQHDRESRSRLR